MWDYEKADSKNRKELDLVNWQRLIDRLDINAQVAAFNETILNVFRNYVPNKYITIDNKDLFLDERKYKNKDQRKRYILPKIY